MNFVSDKKAVNKGGYTMIQIEEIHKQEAGNQEYIYIHMDEHNRFVAYGQSAYYLSILYPDWIENKDSHLDKVNKEAYLIVPDECINLLTVVCNILIDNEWTCFVLSSVLKSHILSAKMQTNNWFEKKCSDAKKDEPVREPDINLQSMVAKVDTACIAIRLVQQPLWRLYGSKLLRILIAGGGLAICLVSATVALPFYIINVLTRKKTR